MRRKRWPDIGRHRDFSEIPVKTPNKPVHTENAIRAARIHVIANQKLGRKTADWILRIAESDPSDYVAIKAQLERFEKSRDKLAAKIGPLRWVQSSGNSVHISLEDWEQLVELLCDDEDSDSI